MRKRLVWLALAVGAVAAGFVARACRQSAEPRANPPPGWEWPVNEQMQRQGQECLVRLDERGVGFVDHDVEVERIATNIIVPDMTFGGVKLAPRFRDPPFPMDCHLALALARVGPDLRALGVRELRFSQIHELRRARSKGTRKKALSRHSYGLAVDVFENVTDDGTVWSVRNHRGRVGDSPESIVIAVERLLTSSPVFSLVMSPGNDPVSHGDHFHLEGRVLPQESGVDRAALQERRARLDHCPAQAGDPRAAQRVPRARRKSRNGDRRRQERSNKRRDEKRKRRKDARRRDKSDPGL